MYFASCFGLVPACGVSAGFALPGRYQKRSEEHTSELQSQSNLVCRLLLEKKKKTPRTISSSRNTKNRRIHRQSCVVTTSASARVTSRTTATQIFSMLCYYTRSIV